MKMHYIAMSNMKYWSLTSIPVFFLMLSNGTFKWELVLQQLLEDKALHLTQSDDPGGNTSVAV